jgi:hypothetical protein
MDGFSRLSRILVSGSKSAYEMKKIDRQALYRPVDILCKLFWRPSILAFPMFVLSRKANRYSIQSCSESVSSSLGLVWFGLVWYIPMELGTDQVCRGVSCPDSCKYELASFRS